MKKKKEPVNPIYKTTLKKGSRLTKKKSIVPLENNNIDFPVVGIGGSAGAFQALEQFFTNVPAGIGMAFIVVMHLDPTKKGMVPELLQRYTKMKVRQALDGEVIQKNCVYIIPPAKDISILNGRLLLLEPSKPRGFRMPIDFFFQSLGQDQRDRSAAIILSGMGSDGELGIKVIKEFLGLAIVQDPGSTEFNSMPLASISTGFVDYVLQPEEMAEKLLNYFHHPVIKSDDTSEVVDVKIQNALLKIFMLLRTQTGHDFSMYKRSTINRRVERRIAVHQLSGITEYVNYLRENSHEIDVLFKELLIGVTKFFRDKEAFEELEKPLLSLLESKQENEPVRFWVAACSTGEEAYSLAIVLKECMEKLNMSNSKRVQIFATDLDAAAIEKARTGIYFDNLSGDVTEERLNRFFIHQNNHYIIKKEIREMIIFAQHNIIKDSPFTKVDLLSCRNLMIYLNSELQKKLVPLFHYSLNKEGLLFLGNSETVGIYSDLFNPVNNRLRIFKRKDVVSFSSMDYSFTLPRYETPPVQTLTTVNDLLKMNKNNLPEVFQNILLEKYTPPSLIMNERGDVLYVNGSLSRFVEIGTGEPNMNIYKIAKTGIRYELSRLITQSTTNKSTQIREGVVLNINGTDHILRLTCSYIKDPSPLEGLIMIIFEDLGVKEDVKSTRLKKTGSKESDIILELEKELTKTRLQLESTIQQMETSFEELKSSNEELQSTNEELQSTNEESITSKEEMQSLNEELMSINVQYQLKSDELSQTNNDMRNLMDSMEIATIFLDNNLLIKKFTPKAAEIVKLIPSDVGRPLSNLSLIVNYKSLEKELKEVLLKLITKEITVPSRKGKWYSLRITPYRTSENFIAGVVLAFIDVTKMKQLENSLSDAVEYSEGIINSLPDAIIVLDYDYKVVSVNQSFRKLFKISSEQVVGFNLFKTAGLHFPELKRKLDAGKKSKIDITELELKSKVAGSKTLMATVRQMPTKMKEKKLIVVTIRIDKQGRKE
ncbi:MAG: Chemotaxis protein CheR [Bacteroidota bacterium]|jgi:two-component system CheB/CheR fusion protein|nr:Chemotaxis protein CheR [Bacteroidota bacterium]